MSYLELFFEFMKMYWWPVSVMSVFLTVKIKYTFFNNKKDDKA